MKYLFCLLLLLCGCDKLAEAPESAGPKHVLQIVDHREGGIGEPDYWILQDSRTGDEYLVVTHSSRQASVTFMRRAPIK